MRVSALIHVNTCLERSGVRLDGGWGDDIEKDIARDPQRLFRLAWDARADSRISRADS